MWEENQEFGKKSKIMLKTLLKYSYYLSKWFSSSQEKVVPGTSFLFLTQISYIAASFYSFIVSILPFEMTNVIITIGVMGLAAVIMIGLQKRTEKYIYSNKKLFEIDYKKNIYWNRFFGLLFLVVIFFLSIACMIFFLRKDA